jgi:hypothetical protein
MSKVETWHRRHAIQLAAQLPDGIEDARTIVRLIEELISSFLVKPEAKPKPLAVVPIRGDDCA